MSFNVLWMANVHFFPLSYMFIIHIHFFECTNSTHNVSSFVRRPVELPRNGIIGEKFAPIRMKLQKYFWYKIINLSPSLICMLYYASLRLESVWWRSQCSISYQLHVARYLSLLKLRRGDRFIECDEEGAPPTATRRRNGRQLGINYGHL